MLKIGLTGGIGSGKSVAAKHFAKLGAPVIDADTIVHDLIANKKTVLNKIIRHFGKDFQLSDGTLDRKKLREYIFHNPEERHWLEALLHPLVIKNMQQQLRNIKAPYCILVIPLLLETKAITLVDRVLVIDCPASIQIQRTGKRDRVSPQQIKAIIQTQISRQKRLAQADDILKNTGSLTTLKQQIKNLHLKYSKVA